MNNELKGIWKETGLLQLEVQFICADCGKPQKPSGRTAGVGGGSEHGTPGNKWNFDCSAHRMRGLSCTSLCWQYLLDIPTICWQYPIDIPTLY